VVTQDHIEIWTPEKRRRYQIIRKKFLDKFTRIFKHKSDFKTMTKIHDPDHIDEIIQDYGSLSNLDEMAGETTHRKLKADTRASNKLNLEMTLAQKVTTKRILF
jgi:hypothetical protein